MVDKKYQNRGIGRKALQLAIDEIKQTEGLKRIGIYYNPHNPVNLVCLSGGMVEQSAVQILRL